MRELANVSIEPGRGIEPMLVDPMNYAEDQATAVRCRDNLLPLLSQVRMQRSQIEELWDRWYQVWAAKHRYRLYEGRSDLYFPIARKIVEQHVAGIKMQTFPATDSFQVVPNDLEMDPQSGQPIGMDPATQMMARNVSRLMEHDVEQAKVERWSDLFIRQGLIYGTSVAKCYWKTAETTNYRLRKKMLGEGQGYTNMVQEEKIMLFEGPTFQVVNLLDWYIHPITCRDISEARMVFEDCMVDWNFLSSMSEITKEVELDEMTGLETEVEIEGPYSASVVKRIKEKAEKDKDTAGGVSNSDANKDLRLQSYGVTVNQIKETIQTSWKISEIWCKFDLYGDGREISCKVTVCGDEILEIRQNPFFHQMAPYLTWKIIDLLELFYGQGLVESIEHHQYALNAMLNQTLDAVVFQTNHIIVVNTSLLAQAPETLRIAPRAIWKTMANPNEVVSIIRPPDNSQSAFNTSNLIAGSMQDTAGMPPVMQGKMPGKETTATEVNQVAAGAMGAQSALIRGLEAQVFSPMLHMWFMLEQQFRSSENMLRIAGMPPLIVDVNALTLDWRWKWLTGSQVPPMVQAMQAQQKAVSASTQQPGAMGLGAGGAPMAGSPGGGSVGQGAGPSIGNISAF
jgi:hypothetical protein